MSQYVQGKEAQKRIYTTGGLPYIHTTDEGFATGYQQDIVPDKQAIQSEYKKQRTHFRSAAAKNLGMPSVKANSLLKQFKKLAEGQLASKEIQKAQTEVAAKLKQGVKTSGGKNVYQISAHQDTRSALAKTNFTGLEEDISELDKFLQDLKAAALEYTNVPATLLASIEAQAEETSPTSSAWKGKFKEGEIFTSSPKAENSMKKLLGAISRLQKIRAGGVSSVGNITTSSNKTMSEEEGLLRLLSGLVTNVTGSGFEVGFDTAMKMAETYPDEVMKEIAKKFPGRIEFSKSGAAGEGNSPIQNAEELKLTKNYAVNKGDVNYKLITTENGVEAEINLGLSLKDIEAGQDKPVSILGGANLYDFLARSSQLNKNFSLYVMLNGMTHRTQNTKTKKGEDAKRTTYTYGAAGGAQGAWLRARQMIAARGAFIAFSGAGTRQDMAYFIVYRNKVIALDQLFMDIAEGKVGLPVLTIDMTDPSPYVAGYTGLPTVQRYQKAKEATMAILKTSILNITHNTKTLK